MTNSPGAFAPAASRVPAPARVLPWPLLLLLYLGPGLCLTVFFIITAPLLQAAGLPAIWSLLIGTLLVIVPIEGGMLLYARRHAMPLIQPHPAERVRGRSAVWVFAAVLLAFLLPGIGVPFEPLLRSTFFAWLPAWFSAGLASLGSYSSAIQIITLVLWVVSVVLLGPVVEELYFRGLLLPRTPGGRIIAPLLNALLFAIYHFWQPYAVLTITLFALPLAALVWWRKDVRLSMIAHCTINFITFLALAAGVMQR